MHVPHQATHRLIAVAAVTLATALILAVGSLAGLQPPMWPSVHSLLTTEARYAEPVPPCHGRGPICVEGRQRRNG